MIEGISYYPKQKKAPYKKKWWLGALLLAVAIVYLLVRPTAVETRSEAVSIVISEPAVEVLAKPAPIKQPQSEYQPPILLEQLDTFVPITTTNIP